MRNKLIVVLGVHRSGTSAITRGLQALGVDLGETLMPPASGNNEKGFFEDTEISAFNDELLELLGGHWHSLPAISETDLSSEKLADIRMRAIGLLRSKLGSKPFGIKDPRIARLLPFWQQLFEHVGIDVSYVIASRHPMSVAESLRKRDGFDVEKSHYLWLGHVVPAVLYTAGTPRVVVSYDRLMEEPMAQLERIAATLGLPFDRTSPDIEEYVGEFLEARLRHSRFESNDLHIHPAIPQGVIDVYGLLDRIARDELSIDAPEVTDAFVRMQEHLKTIRPALDYMTRSDRRVKELGGQNLQLNQTLLQRDAEVASLQRVLAERNDQVASLNDQVTRLNQTLGARDEQIASLNQTVAEHEAELYSLKHAHEAFVNSTSWRVTKPLRVVGHQVKRMGALWRLMPKIVATGGGLPETGLKALKVLRREGMDGVKRRIMYVATGGRSSYQNVDSLPFGGHAVQDYAEWIRRYDTLTDAGRTAMRKRIEELEAKPLISVIMPVYNPRPEWLVAAIESVRNQIYPHWELCISDDLSTEPQVRPILEDYERKDARIKVVFRKTNGHISAASNSALELASGDFVALLDHDDLLSEHALFWVAETIADNPDAQLVYSDEDKIDADGQRSEPYFKCDWNEELFYSHNMISHLGVYRAKLVREVGGFRESFEGSQDYDLALRCIERIEPGQIVHIPRVLYHWRTHQESTASAGEAKPYAFLAAEKAINEHLQRKGVEGKVELLSFGMYRVRYGLPESLPKVSLIIPTRNGLALVRQCVESILSNTDYPDYEIIVVDNGSDDPDVLNYFKVLDANPLVRILRDDRPFNFSALNNAAVAEARGELVCLLNNDIEVINAEWLREMVSLALQSGVGAVGARLWYPNDTLQHGGVILGVGGVASHSHKQMPRGQYGYFGRACLIQSFSAVTAACLVIRKTVYQQVGGMNETDLPVAFNDVDFCLRLREAGYRNVWTPYAELYHHESATRGNDDAPEKRERFAREIAYMHGRWGALLLNDPAYSPNLTLHHDDFGLAWPPRTPKLIHSPTKGVFPTRSN
jgi:glycosyltransferase involved in cell wall biosynthesis